MKVKIVPRTAGAPAGKLADAELHFSDGLLAGLKLVGFTVWDRHDPRGRSVTFPARQYTIDGERRHFVLLRASEEAARTDQLRDLILRAYSEHEGRLAAAASRQRTVP